MTDKTIQLLQCPYCHTPFRKGFSWKNVQQQGQYGSVICGCDEFPVVADILFLHRPRHRAVLECIRRDQLTEALLMCLTDKPKLHPTKLWMKLGGIRFAQHVLRKDFLRKLGKGRLVQLLSPFLPIHLLRYYFTRDQWMDSLLLTFPLGALSTAKRKQKNLYWLDVGSGIFNFYQEIQTLAPGLHIISLESDFFNIFISAVFYPGGKVTRVCGDGHFVQVVCPKTLDVVTVIDALQHHQVPLLVVKQLTEKGWLKKEHLVFFSNLPEHLYLPKEWTVFPIPRKILQSTFPTQPLFLNNELLAKQVREGEVNVEQVLLKRRKMQQDIFRYAVLWQAPKINTSTISFTFLPKQMRETAVKVWTDHPITWGNSVY